GTGLVWQALANTTGGGSISTVNGLTGASITLSTDNIGEGATNQYFTNARAKGAAGAGSLHDAITDIAPPQNALLDALATRETPTSGKEPALTASTNTQYYRGDKTWQTLNSSAVPEGTNLYYTDTRARTAAVADALNDGTTNVAPSQNAVYDAIHALTATD